MAVGSGIRCTLCTMLGGCEAMLCSRSGTAPQELLYGVVNVKGTGGAANVRHPTIKLVQMLAGSLNRSQLLGPLALDSAPLQYPCMPIPTYSSFGNAAVKGSSNDVCFNSSSKRCASCSALTSLHWCSCRCQLSTSAGTRDVIKAVYGAYS
jgi:hypothetical protein